ncbi:helicase associated domain-containing protein [Streptomyces sp. NBC_01174]|uniref:helicase associated domain-containing protein n=1 Tax=Streptomyces sp. NBC_01174 TaxID=2903758 RepID=UPI0038660B04
MAGDRGYEAASAYFRLHGDLKVPRRHSASSLRLDAWLGRQRAARREGLFSDSRIDALNQVGMNWGKFSPSS